ncbi:hypothetical protein J5X84_43805 [Streptosporangiaceae bacterium NEAU-GS5]|nr:hypothetical protein [Streptosporangiaceae bacterium NEAU-GS5]
MSGVQTGTSPAPDEVVLVTFDREQWRISRGQSLTLTSMTQALIDLAENFYRRAVSV